MALERPELRFPDPSRLELDRLVGELQVAALGVRQAQGRLRALIRAIATVTSELELDAVLRNLLDAARDLAGARYGALGVIGQDGQLERFLHVGMDDAMVAAIGQLPKGTGLLGALLTEPRPIRLRNLRDDARASGFPPGHPAMESFIGVPVRSRGEVFGTLFLADSSRGEFGEEDEELLVALAQAAGTAIGNARRYEESRQQQKWLAASLKTTARLLGSDGEEPLRLISRAALEVAGADLVAVSLLTADRAELRVEEACGTHADTLVGRSFPVGETIGGRVIASGTPALLERGVAQDGRSTHLSTVLDAGPLMVLPLGGTGPPRGVLSVARVRGRAPFEGADLAMAAGFASHASIALELADARAAEQRLALRADRERIAMDLHDHVVQELFALGLGLESAATRLGPAHWLTAELKRDVEDIDRTIRRIRTSIFQLRGAAVTAVGGLHARLLAIAQDMAPALGFTPPVTFRGVVDAALAAELTDDVLACVREALTNVAKHAHATAAAVDVSVTGRLLTVAVSDDGVGPGGGRRASGTVNLRARAQKWHGSFDLAAGPNGGALLIWTAQLS